MTSGTWGALAVAVLALVGTLYTARNARAAGREQAEQNRLAVQEQVQPAQRALDQAAFKLMQESLQTQINGLREEIGVLKQDVDKLHDDIEDRETVIRIATDHIRDLNRYISNPESDRPQLPGRLVRWSV